MALLSAAEGGDYLVSATMSSPGMSFNYYAFAGSGQETLSGLNKVEALTGNAGLVEPEMVPLGSLYADYVVPGRGLAGVRISGSEVNVLGHAGGMAASTHTINRVDTRSQWAAIAAGLFGISLVGSPISFVAGAAGIPVSAFAADIQDAVPGMREGDVRLQLGLCVDLGSSTTAAVYQTYFRNGVNRTDSIMTGTTVYGVPRQIPPPVGP